MSDIKFACPHCAQHVTCDAEYCDAVIDCPACGNGMVVPRLTATDSAHPAMLLVASAPAPKHPAPPVIPTIRALTEREWAEHSRKFGGADNRAPLWIFTLIGTLIIAFVLQIDRAAFWPILFCLIVGSGLTMVLIIKDMRANAGHSLLKGLGLVFTILLLIPVIAVGVLFIGCMGCH